MVFQGVTVQEPLTRIVGIERDLEILSRHHQNSILLALVIGAVVLLVRRIGGGGHLDLVP